MELIQLTLFLLLVGIFPLPLSHEDVAEEVVEDKDEAEKMEYIPQILREVVQDLKELNRELRSMMSPPPRDTSSQQPPVVPDVDGKALEQEYRMYPASTRNEVSDRLSNQVWDLLRIMQERVRVMEKTRSAMLPGCKDN